MSNMPEFRVPPSVAPARRVPTSERPHMPSPASVFRFPPCGRRLLLCALTGAALLAAMPGAASADCQPIQCAKPDAVTGAATNISSTAATLNGTVNTRGTSNGTWRFLFGTTDANMTVVASGLVDDRDVSVPVSFNATGLAPGTSYQYYV